MKETLSNKKLKRKTFLKKIMLALGIKGDMSLGHFTGGSEIPRNGKPPKANNALLFFWLGNAHQRPVKLKEVQTSL